MSAEVAYLDSSAFVKLIVAEAESAALVQFLNRWPRRASANVLWTESLRAIRRYGQHYVATARRLLPAVQLVSLDQPLLDRAGVLGPPGLRTLDALHLTAAMSLGADLGVFVAYDERLADAARLEGLDVRQPR